MKNACFAQGMSLYRFKLKLLLALTLLVVSAGSAFASLTYDVVIDTSGLSGTSGYLYFQYGGINAVDSTVVLYGYTGGTLASSASAEAVDSSAVTGELPGTVTFANTNGINDYNHGILFGDSLQFSLIFASDGFDASSGGSTFSLSLFEDELGYAALLTDDGTLFTIDLMNDGTISFETVSNTVNVATTPIPAAAWLLGSGLLGLLGVRRRIR